MIAGKVHWAVQAHQSVCLFSCRLNPIQTTKIFVKVMVHSLWKPSYIRSIMFLIY